MIKLITYEHQYCKEILNSILCYSVIFPNICFANVTHHFSLNIDKQCSKLWVHFDCLALCVINIFRRSKIVSLKCEIYFNFFNPILNEFYFFKLILSFFKKLYPFAPHQIPFLSFKIRTCELGILLLISRLAAALLFDYVI